MKWNEPIKCGNYVFTKNVLQMTTILVMFGLFVWLVCENMAKIRIHIANWENGWAIIHIPKYWFLLHSCLHCFVIVDCVYFLVYQRYNSNIYVYSTHNKQKENQTEENKIYKSNQKKMKNNSGFVDDLHMQTNTNKVLTCLCNQNFKSKPHAQKYIHFNAQYIYTITYFVLFCLIF